MSSNRGMKKYLPFASLTEQAQYLSKMMEEKSKVTKPQISIEQAEKINKILLNYHSQELVIKFYIDGHIYNYEGRIDKINKKEKILIIHDYILSFSNIIDINDISNCFDDIC